MKRFGVEMGLVEGNIACIGFALLRSVALGCSVTGCWYGKVLATALST